MRVRALVALRAVAGLAHRRTPARLVQVRALALLLVEVRELALAGRLLAAALAEVLAEGGLGEGGDADSGDQEEKNRPNIDWQEKIQRGIIPMATAC